jgi:tetratricopeptide (TPR) repeat protein
MIEPDTAEKFIERGLSFYDKGDFDSAMDDFTRALNLDMHCARSYYIRGVLYGVRCDYDASIADLTDAYELDPEDSHYSNALSLAYRERSDVFIANGDDVAAKADFAKAVRLDITKTMWNLVMQASGDFVTDNYDECITKCNEALRLDMSAPTQDSSQHLSNTRWNLRHMRGEIYRIRGDYPAAIADFTEAIHINPEEDNPWFGRARAYFHLRDYESALRDYKNCKRTIELFEEKCPEFKPAKLCQRDSREHRELQKVVLKAILAIKTHGEY